MPRLRNKATGVVVSVADGKKLDGYVPVEDAAKTEPTKKVAPKKSGQ